VQFEKLPRASITASDLIPDDIFPRIIALLSHWLSKFTTKDDKQRQDSVSFNRHSLFEIIKECYWLFRKRYDKDKRQSDLENLHQIVWFVLAFLGDDADTGLFRPYSEINASNSRMLVDYLLLNPKDHLALFLMHNRDAQYSSLSKYGMGFDGTEAGGSTYSSWGLNRTLGDVPLSKHLLEPAIQQLFDANKTNDKDILRFWHMLNQDWIKTGKPASSLHPAALRRACVPVAVKLLASTPMRRMAKEVYATLAFLVTSSEGIPSTCDKVFSELRTEEALFGGSRRSIVRKLIEIDIKRSLFGIPTSYFAFECLLKLVVAGDKKARKLLHQLLNTPAFHKREGFDFDIIANIENVCGAASSSLKFAVKLYQKSPDWQANASQYTKETAQRFIAANAKSLLLPSSISREQKHPQEADIIIQSQLLELAATDFSEFALKISKIQNGRSLADSFSDRNFVLTAIGKLFDQLRQEPHIDNLDQRVSAALELLRYLADDPDPIPNDENDNRTKEGEILEFITGIRTHTCFEVSKLACLKPYFLDAWQLTMRLLHDRSSYVQYFAFNPFIEILKRKSWNDTVRDEAVKTLWSLFDHIEYPAHLEKLLLTFNYVRDLSEKDAERVLTKFVDHDGIEPLFVFYGIFRSQHIAKMGPFDSSRFEYLLVNSIESGKGDLPLRIMRTFTKVFHEDTSDAVLMMPYLLRYSQPSHAQADIINEGKNIFNELLKRPTMIELTHVRQFILNMTKLERLFWQREDVDAGRVWLFPLDSNALNTFYDLDHEGFYEYLRLVESNLEYCKRLPVSDDLFPVLNAETDAARFVQIRQFLDTLVDYHPQYYPCRQTWLDSQAKLLGFPRVLEP
jgi:hypothetical protein